MHLYRLTRIDPDEDVVAGFVIAAEDELAARAIPAAECACGDECRSHVERSGDARPCLWQSAAASTCEHIGTTNAGWAPCVVLRDFRPRD